MAERAPSMQLLEWIQKRVSDLSDSIKTTRSVIQAWDTLHSNMRDQISHLQKLEGGFSFLKERIAYLQNTIEQNSQSDADRKIEQYDKFTALHHSMSQHTMTMEEHLRKISNLIIFAQQQETLNQTQNQRMINLETELKQQTLINTTLKQSNISLVQTDLQRIQTLETRLNSALDYQTNSAQTDPWGCFNNQAPKA